MPSPYKEEKFYLALVTKLRTDTELAALVSHTALDLRIARLEPIIKAKIPYLGVRLDASIPAVDNAMQSLFRSSVSFYNADRQEINCLKVRGRLLDLLKATGNEDAGVNGNFFNISNSVLTNKMTRLMSLGEVNYDESSDVWESRIRVDFIWVDVPCS